MPTVKSKLFIDRDALKKVKLVAVAYSFVDREFFPTEDAFSAEKEVEERAREVMLETQQLGIEVKSYPAETMTRFTGTIVSSPTSTGQRMR